MKTGTKQREEAEAAIIERLRFAFPELGEMTLRQMAALHPAAIRERMAKQHPRPRGRKVEIICL